MSLFPRFICNKATLLSFAVLSSFSVSLPVAMATEPAALTIYNSQDKGPVEAVAAAYEKKTGVKITFRDNGAPALAQQIIAEGKKTPADIFYAEYTSALVSLSNKGLLADIPAGSFQQIPAQYSDNQHKWLGITARSFVIMYNQTMIHEEQLPHSVMDFAKPEWQGKFAYNPRAAAFLEMIVAVEKTVGYDAAKNWLAGIKKNGKAYPTNTAMVLDVDRGEVATAINGDNYWQAVAKDKGADKLNVKVHYVGHQDPGALITVSGVGIPEYAPHRAEAEKFVAYLVSPEGQNILAQAAGDTPLRPGIISPVALKPFDKLDASPVTSAQIGDASDALQLEKAVGLN